MRSSFQMNDFISPSFRARRFLALLPACGFAANSLLYVSSFYATESDIIVRWDIFVSCLGMIALFIPMYILEYPAGGARTFLSSWLAPGTPRWVAVSCRLLVLVGVGHFIWFAAHSGWGVPVIRGEQYVLNSRGRILKVLSQPEYLALMNAERRMFATIFMSAYFVLAMYWWFSRHPRQEGADLGPSTRDLATHRTETDSKL